MSQVICVLCGVELGSTDVIKILILLGMISPQRIKNVNANDNIASVGEEFAIAA